MEKLAAALGLTTDANETALLAAFTSGFVPKATHDETLAQLSAATTELTQMKDAGRKAEIGALLAAAIKDKKIVPAEKDHYEALCATDAGLSSVKLLLAAKVVTLAGSGLNTKKAPEGGDALTAAQLAAKANKMVEAGEAPDYLSALSILSDKQAAA